ncbi:MAG TPA: hypothetical protein VNQ90_02195 [Chthoniobacteraceae bacterium]|nr:hypothetical protein [Chthoniobacteraceae bacterium]
MSDTATISGKVSEGWCGFLEILYRCPRSSCGRTFLATFKRLPDSFQPHDKNIIRFIFDCSSPSNPKPRFVDPKIVEISPDFSKIYNQSLEAKRLGLDQVCGGGLRRALEFLIKDYLIYKQSDEKSKIMTTSLGACINNYLPKSNIKDCASRAAWLGNDEIHYIRKYNSHDIADLEALIRLTLYWINAEIMTEDYKESLSKR